MKHNAGFSLIEVLCAILILGVGIVGLTVGITGALGSRKDAELQTAAALIAEGRLETLRAEGYVIEGNDEGEGGSGLELYRWKQSVVNGSIDGLFEVKVTVEHARTGRELYQLQTLLFDPPVYSESYRSKQQENNPAARRRNRGRQP
jgi:type IV pilus modification protein PilV